MTGSRRQHTARSRNGKPIVVRSARILGGTPVFAGTRVPVQALFDYLEAGERVDDFLRDFPTVTRRMTIAVLELAGASFATRARAS